MLRALISLQKVNSTLHVITCMYKHGCNDLKHTVLKENAKVRMDLNKIIMFVSLIIASTRHSNLSPLFE